MKDHYVFFFKISFDMRNRAILLWVHFLAQHTPCKVRSLFNIK